MYKIYIKESLLLLTNSQEGKALLPGKEGFIVAPMSGRSHHILKYVNLLENASNFTTVVLYDDDVESLFKRFEELFKEVGAAGGVVRNDDGKILMIFRRGYWDLPKGKIDPGESEPEAALREVTEETGVDGLTLGEFICPTYHIYREKKQRYLKKTYWYKMSTSENGVLTPQAEEGIELAGWYNPEDLINGSKKTYQNIAIVTQREIELTSKNIL
jgi:8-oxo-dGTP pyrophosphatase MutT (NUDIX family)